MRLLACTETVTLVRHQQEPTGDVYRCEVIVGVSWHSKAGSMPSANGETPKAEFVIRIPAELAPDPLPKDGDYLVRGVLGAFDGSRRTLKDREYFQINYVGDNRRGVLLPHIVVKG